MPGEKDREREKKNEYTHKKLRKYGQARLKHSKKGIASCVIAVILAIVLITLISITYQNEGKAASYIGGFGISAFFFSIIGILVSVHGIKEHEGKILTCKIGLVCNSIFLLSWVIFFLGGII